MIGETGPLFSLPYSLPSTTDDPTVAHSASVGGSFTQGRHRSGSRWQFLYISELRLQSRLLAQLIGSDSVEGAVPLHRDRPFPVGVDRVPFPFAQQRKPIFLQVLDQLLAFYGDLISLLEFAR